MKDDTMKAEALKRITDRDVMPGQRYRHYKTGNIYLVIAVGLFEADLEPLVHYRNADDEYGTIWTRHLDIFCGSATHEGVLAARFTRIE